MVFPLIPIAMGLAEIFAPKLIKQLAGEDAANVASQVIEMGKQITGVTDPTAIAPALRNNPELALQFQTAADKLETRLAEIDLENTKDARHRDVELRKLGFDNSRADKMILGDITGLLISVVALTIFAVVEIVFNVEITGVVWSTFGGLTAHFGNGWMQAHNFEFGSSRGSKMKDSLQEDSK